MGKLTYREKARILVRSYMGDQVAKDFELTSQGKSESTLATTLSSLFVEYFGADQAKRILAESKMQLEKHTISAEHGFDFRWYLGFLFFSVVTSFLIFPGEEDMVLKQLVYLVAPLLGVLSGWKVCAAFGWEGMGRVRSFRFSLAGLSAWFGGELVTFYYIFQGELPYPSLADVFFLSGDALFVTAILMEVKSLGLSWRNLRWAQMVKLGAAFAALISLVAYTGFVGFDDEASLLVNLTTFSWTIGDLAMGLLILLLLTLVWQYQGGLIRREWLWFMGAVLANFVADSIYDLYPEAVADGSALNTFLNAIWTAGYVFFIGYFFQVSNSLGRIEQDASLERAPQLEG